MKIITRLNVLLVSVTGLLVAGYLYRISPDQFANGNCWSVLMECTRFKWVFALSVFAPVLVFSLVIYKTKDQVFRSWAWLSIIFSTIYIYIVGSSKSNGSDGFSPTLIQTVLFTWFLYFLLSILVTIIQLFRTRTTK